MNIEQQKLVELLKNNKINKDEYALLMGALSPSNKSKVFSFLLNPYEKFSTPVALAVGVTTLLLLSIVAQLFGFHFPDTLSLQEIKTSAGSSLGRNPFFQNIVIVLVTSILFYLSALLYKQRNLRFIDFVATNLLTRFPYLVAAIILTIVYKISGFDPHQEPKVELSNLALFPIAITGIACLAWCLAMMFYSLKESSGLIGKKLWVSYLTTLLLSVVITLVIFRLILN
ncbi:MAG: hypothetical protein H6623_08945 [Bdellovibrionaceae bacterium]|nr:hypothetical protein [Pseudobdellovibrionaceae bacterium]